MTTSITLERFLSSWNPGEHFICVTSLGPQDTLMEIPRLSSLCALGKLRLRDFFQGRTAPKWQSQESNTGLISKSLLLITMLSFRYTFTETYMLCSHLFTQQIFPHSVAGTVLSAGDSAMRKYTDKNACPHGACVTATKSKQHRKVAIVPSL